MVVFADAAIADAVKCWGQMLDVILLALIEVFHVVRVLYSILYKPKKQGYVRSGRIRCRKGGTTPAFSTKTGWRTDDRGSKIPYFSNKYKSRARLNYLKII